MKYFQIISFLLLISLCSCFVPAVEEARVREDLAFKNLFFADSNGITGADGIFSVPLSEDETVFFLGDCFLGKVVDGSRDMNTTMMRNAFVVVNQEKSEVRAVYNGEYDNPVTLMNPLNEEGDTTYRWYWPGHGFLKDGILYVFALNLYNEPSAIVKSTKGKEELNEADVLQEAALAFRISHIDLLAFSIPDFEHLGTIKADFDYTKYPIDFGNCVMVDEGYVYIYGTKNDPGMSKVHVARVPLEAKEFHTNWEYSAGDAWDTDISKSVPIDIDISVSEQFSIFRYKDMYVLLTQERGGADIFTYTSSYPNRGFQNKQFIYHTPDREADSAGHIHAYNALAHSQYIEQDQLLVSYCVNSTVVKDVFENAEAYRAKFIRVPMDMITNNKQQKARNVTIDSEFTDFFARDCCGLTGADGLYSVILPDGRTVWTFGDTFLGTVNQDNTREPRIPVFVRNSIAVQDGDSLRTLYNVYNGMDASYFIAREAYKNDKLEEDSIWFWPGDALMENGKVKFFLSRFYRDKSDMWGFRWNGIYIATVSYPELEVEEIVPVSYPSDIEIHWGHAVCDDAGDFTYIYGTGEEHPYVARAPKGNIHEPWEFYTGQEWVGDANLAKPLTEDISSEQFSVFRLGDKYVLLTQTGGLSREICTYTSDLPYAEFSEKTVIAIADPPAHLPDSNLFTYNALAHPQFIADDELLVSYCVNSFNIRDLFHDAGNYRPIFLRIPLELILKK